MEFYFSKCVSIFRRSFVSFFFLENCHQFDDGKYFLNDKLNEYSLSNIHLPHRFKFAGITASTYTHTQTATVRRYGARIEIVLLFRLCVCACV